MFDIGWSEMAIIFLVALIIIGPKDLPRVARTVGKWTGKARAMAREFQRSLDDMAREAELDEIKKTINKAGSGGITAAIKETIDPKGEIEAATDMSDLGSIDLDDDDKPAKPATANKPQTATKPVAAAAAETSSAEAEPVGDETAAKAGESRTS